MERVLTDRLEELGIERAGYLAADEWTTFGGVQTPTYLVTHDNYRTTLEAAGIVFGKVANTLEKGTDDTDAGDTHGQYHNEAQWYADQMTEATANEATAKLEGFDRAVIISGYDEVREAMIAAGIEPSQQIVIGSHAKIEYNDDPTDVEDITLVAKLDGGFQAGWVSVSTPLAMALSGKKAGDTVSFKVEENRPNIKPIKVKILEIS